MGRYKFSILGFNRKREIDKLSDLRFLVLQLDNIRAFRRARTKGLEDSFERIHSTNVWKKIRHDVEGIIYFPNTIPGVLSLIKIVAALRTFFPLCLGLMIFALLIRLGFIPMVPLAVFYTLFVLPVLVMVAFVSVDFIIRRKVTKYEGEHPAMQNEEKEHIKAVIEELILKLLKEIKSRGENPGDYRMKLFHGDYRGIMVIKERREKVYGIFKRKYSTYIAIPSL